MAIILESTWTYESGGTVTQPSITISGSNHNDMLFIALSKDDDEDLDITLLPENLYPLYNLNSGTAIGSEIFIADSKQAISLHDNYPVGETYKDYSGTLNLTYGGSFNSTGSRFQLSGHDGTNYVINDYILSTPYAISSSSSTSSNSYIFGYTVRDHRFSADGFKLFVLSTNGVLYEHILTSAFDISTIAASITSATLSTALVSFTFTPDGTRIYGLSPLDGTVLQYDLTAAFDLTQSVSLSSSKISRTLENGSVKDSKGIEISNDGRTLLIGWSGRIWEFTLSKPFELGLYDQNGYLLTTDLYQYVNIGITDPRGLIRGPTDATLYCVTETQRAYHYTLNTTLATVDGTYTFTGDNEEYCITAHVISGTALENRSGGGTSSGSSAASSTSPVPRTVLTGDLVIAGFAVDGDSTPITNNAPTWDHTLLQSTAGSGSVGQGSAVLIAPSDGSYSVIWSFDSADELMSWGISYKPYDIESFVEVAANLQATSSCSGTLTDSTSFLNASLPVVSSLTADLKNSTIKISASLPVVINLNAELPPSASLQVTTNLTAACHLVMSLKPDNTLNCSTELIADTLPANAFQTVLTQFFNEDGTEISSPMLGAPNLDLNIDINSPSAQNYFWTTADYDITLKARWLVRNTTGSSILFNPILQVRKDGGTWEDLQTINPGDPSGFTNNTYFSCYRGLPDGPATAHLSGQLAIGDSSWSSLLHPHKVLDYLGGDKILVWFGKQGNGVGNFLPDYTVCRWDAITGNVTTLQTAVMYEASVNAITQSSIGDTGICSMVNGDIYFLGIANSTTEATMMKYNGSTWAEITGHGWPTNAAGAYLNKIELFEDSGTLYAIGGYVVSAGVSSIGVYSFNGTTWSLEAHDGYVPTGGVKYLHTLVHDKVAGVLYYLLRNSANTELYSVDKVTYNIGTKTFSAPVVAFSAGTITASLTSLAFVMGEPSPHNANLYYTFGGYQTISGYVYGKLFELNKSTNTWTIHGYEAVYVGVSAYNAFTFWNGALDKLVVVGVNGTTRMFNYDSVSDTYHTNLGYGTPMNIYVNGNYLSTEPFILNASGTSEPIYYVEYGSSDYNFSADGYYIYGYSQDLDNIDQHWTDTTKQLPSSNTYTYKGVNGANITRTPYLENTITLSDNEEVELAYSLQINKTQLDNAGINAKLEYRLFNQNLTYPISDREHYPTINYIDHDEHLLQADLQTVCALTASATVGTTTDKFIQADLQTVCALTASATVDPAFIEGDATFNIVTNVSESGSQLFHGDMLFEYNIKTGFTIAAPIVVMGLKAKLNVITGLRAYTGDPVIKGCP